MASSKRPHKQARQQRKKARRDLKLQQGRPPLAPKPQGTISSVASRVAIKAHHQLNKDLAKARKNRDQDRVVQLLHDFNNGGLERYQTASLQAQANDRGGGDSSKALTDWLDKIKPQLKSAETKLRMLEVGALSM